jgi:AcrR family transcriptional regulator
VGINSLCREAGVVKGSFYHFFPSKQALLDAVFERNTGRSSKLCTQRRLPATTGAAGCWPSSVPRCRRQANYGRTGELGCGRSPASELATVKKARPGGQRRRVPMRPGWKAGAQRDRGWQHRPKRRPAATQRFCSLLSRHVDAGPPFNNGARQHRPTTAKRLLPVRA